MLPQNLPEDVVRLILQYDNVIKYRYGKYVNQINKQKYIFLKEHIRTKNSLKKLIFNNNFHITIYFSNKTSGIILNCIKNCYTFMYYKKEKIYFSLKNLYYILFNVYNPTHIVTEYEYT